MEESTSVGCHQSQTKRAANSDSADFEKAKFIDNREDFPNCDYEGLGKVILGCMNGQRTEESSEGLRHMRTEGKPWNVKEGDRWCGSKYLFDFLDALFTTSIRPHAKFANLVRSFPLDGVQILIDHAISIHTLSTNPWAAGNGRTSYLR